MRMSSSSPPPPPPPPPLSSLLVYSPKLPSALSSPPPDHPRSYFLWRTFDHISSLEQDSTLVNSINTAGAGGEGGSSSHLPVTPRSPQIQYLQQLQEKQSALLPEPQIIIMEDLPSGFAESTGRSIIIGMMSAFGSALLVVVILAIVYFFRYTRPGRIFLDRMGRPGEFDDEQQFAKDEAEALEGMDDMQRMEYFRAKAFISANPPESAQTDISLSQFLAIQEKGVSAWEFEPELEIANCFVEGRTEIEFYDSECSVQSNLPVPKQNEVYYWEAKIYDKPETTTISIGMTTKPYPLFRLPGLHKTSLAYTSSGLRRYNQPFNGTPYGPAFVQGDVIGVGYRPRSGTVFFTRNGKKLEDMAHGLRSPNFFPTVGANGPCQVHVNFGQLGFVFIEANVKKWGLAPMTGSLAPPPPYGSEQGSILLEGGRDGVREGMGLQGYFAAAGFHQSPGQFQRHPSPIRHPAYNQQYQHIQQQHGHSRSPSQQQHVRLATRLNPTSPGPQRSPTDISLSQLSVVDPSEFNDSDQPRHADGAVGQTGNTAASATVATSGAAMEPESTTVTTVGLGFSHEDNGGEFPPEYESPNESVELAMEEERRVREREAQEDEERTRRRREEERDGSDQGDMSGSGSGASNRDRRATR